MPLIRTTGSQDKAIADAESDQTVPNLIAIIKDFDERLDRAIKRLDAHEIDTSDL